MCEPVRWREPSRERRGRFLPSTASIVKWSRPARHKTDRSRGSRPEGKPREYRSARAHLPQPGIPRCGEGCGDTLEWFESHPLQAMTDMIFRFNSSHPRETVDHTDDVQKPLTSPMVRIQSHRGAIHGPMERFDSYRAHVDVVHPTSERILFNRWSKQARV